MSWFTPLQVTLPQCWQSFVDLFYLALPARGTTDDGMHLAPGTRIVCYPMRLFLDDGPADFDVYRPMHNSLQQNSYQSASQGQDVCEKYIQLTRDFPRLANVNLLANYVCGEKFSVSHDEDENVRFHDRQWFVSAGIRANVETWMAYSKQGPQRIGIAEFALFEEMGPAIRCFKGFEGVSGILEDEKTFLFKILIQRYMPAMLDAVLDVVQAELGKSVRIDGLIRTGLVASRKVEGYAAPAQRFGSLREQSAQRPSLPPSPTAPR